MSKLTSLFIIASLLCFTLSHAARPHPALHDKATSLKTQYKGVEADQTEVLDESCGVGDEECLMRRTLAAHLDYIYTQKQKP